MASGKAHFWFDGVEEVVTSGHMVLYQPKEDVYKRQVLCRTDTILFLEYSAKIEWVIIPYDLCNFSNIVSVSYTHLDVYKRQVTSVLRNPSQTGP